MQLKVDQRAANDTLPEMSEQLAKCETIMKEIMERLHNYEELEAKSVSFEQDLKAVRAKKEVV